MDMKVHCPGCTKSLRVPKTSSGRKARCPNCQKVFVVPQPDELVDETISTWIEEDVGKLEVEHERHWENIGSIKSYQRPAPSARPVSSGRPVNASDLRNPARSPAVAAGAASKTGPGIGTAGGGDNSNGNSGNDSDGSNHSEESTIAAMEDLTPHPETSADQTIEVTPTTRRPAGSSVTMPDPAAPAAAPAAVTVLSRGAAGDQSDQPYPTSLRVDAMQPHLVVVRCDQAGVCFAFDSVHLEHMGFRMSMPLRCAFSGETERRKLFARPFAFIDRSGARIRSPHEIESKYTTTLLSGQSARELLDVMGNIDSMPKPFSFSVPYFGTNEFSHQSIKCWTETRSDGGITCFVVIPNGITALQWLLNVNGTTGIEYAKLEHDITLLDNDAWRQLGDECRRRLAVWCPFEPMEQFRLYLSDGDFGSRDKGLAGIVLTDRRLIYCKYHHRGAVDITQAATLIIRDETDFAQLAIESVDGRTKLVRLHDYDVPTLLEAIEQVPTITVDRKASATAATAG